MECEDFQFLQHGSRELIQQPHCDNSACHAVAMTKDSRLADKHFPSKACRLQSHEVIPSRYIPGGEGLGQTPYEMVLSLGVHKIAGN
jgi:hypothetical protein